MIDVLEHIGIPVLIGFGLVSGVNLVGLTIYHILKIFKLIS